MNNATPVFCDIDPDTYHLSIESVRRMYQPEVKQLYILTCLIIYLT
ncbi:MAG: hypothetical protein CM15mV18_1460 [uncultured marine virus]|nr:MAG: hypothetical protein CM15mV18_1460 [uncultured marine virus]